MFTVDELNAKTRKELDKIAESLGIFDIKPTQNKGFVIQEILKRVKEVEEGDVSFARNPVKEDDEFALQKGYARIIISRDPNSKGNYPLVVNGPNDKAVLVPRGVEVDVPRIVYENLKDAETTTHIYNEEDHELIAQTTLSYPFQTVATNF